MKVTNDTIIIDKERFNKAIKAYFLWKELNQIIKTFHTRGINLSEAISEAMVCYAKGFHLKRKGAGDAIDIEQNIIIEIKGTSNFHDDLTSFSPSEEFDGLHFVRLHQEEDKFYLYDLNMNSAMVKKIQVSKNQTFEQQQQEGRRPRFSIIKQIINDKQLEPYAIIDLKNKTIEYIK